MRIDKWLILAVLGLLLSACGGGTGGCQLTFGGIACGDATPENAKPVARAGLDQVVLLDGTVTLDASMSTDANPADKLSYQWQCVSPGCSIELAPSDTSVKPTFQATAEGVYEFTLTVSDGSLTSDVSRTTVTVTKANLPPTALAGTTQSVLINRPVTLDGSGSSDPDAAARGQVLTYSWTLNAPGGSTAVLYNPKTANPVFYPDLPGTYTASLVVSDGQAESAVSVVSVQAASDNAAPTADAGADQNVSYNTLVTLDGSGSKDTDGFVKTYTWTLVHSPVTVAGVVLNLTDPKRPTFTPPKAGDYVFTLTVTDNKDVVSARIDTVAVVAVNAAPVANAGPDKTATIVAPATTAVVTLAGSASDVNGDTMSYTWTIVGQPNGGNATFDNNKLLAPKLTVSVPGDYLLQLVANDGSLDSAPSRVWVKVN